MFEFLTKVPHIRPRKKNVCDDCSYLRGLSVSIICNSEKAKNFYGVDCFWRTECIFWKRQRTWGEVVKEYQRGNFLRKLFNNKPDDLFYIKE